MKSHNAPPADASATAQPVTAESPNGLNNLPVDTIVEAWGFGAEPKRCVILSRQRASDGTYMLGVQGDTSNCLRVGPDNISRVLQFPPPGKMTLTSKPRQLCPAA